MKNNDFWLYYSLIMLVGFYPVVANAYSNDVPYIVLSETHECSGNNDRARQEGSCGTPSNLSSDAAYLYKVKDRWTGLDVFPDACDNNGTYVEIMASPTYFCVSCPSGYTLMPLEKLIGYNYVGQAHYYNNATGMTAGVDFSWYTPGTLGEEIYDYCHNQGNTCYFNSADWGGMDPKVCIKCETVVTPGEWTTYGSNRVRRAMTSRNGCTGETTTTYEYACVSGSCRTGGSGSSLTCVTNKCSGAYRVCPPYNHVQYCKCNYLSGYYNSGTAASPNCVACPTPTEIYTGSSGTTVPGVFTPDSTNQNAAAACRVAMGAYHDTTGYWTYAAACTLGGSLAS